MRWKRSGKIKGKPLESVAVVSMNLVLQCSGICSFLSDTHVFRSYISESGVKQTNKKKGVKSPCFPFWNDEYRLAGGFKCSF